MAPHAESAPTPPEERAPAVQEAFTDSSANSRDAPTFVQVENRSHLRCTPKEEVHDLVCVGFGPASLAIAVALHDAIEGSDANLHLPHVQTRRPRVAFLEKQSQFRWHAGMLLPGARMQITFMKDMATMRNPRSQFTFINYLYQKNRLVEFANLNTFLPQRIEYEDYMKWCASWFEEVVAYDQEVVKVIPEKSANGKIHTFAVVSTNLQTGQTETRRTKHVVVAAGGRPNLPPPFPTNHSKVIHSSKFSHICTKLLQDHRRPYNIAVVGNGQSAAEIFDFLHAHFPNARTRLLIKGGALRPSDDSPFVNEIFNPDRVDPTFNRDATLRATALQEDKGTNYGVVRLNLLERLYETLYIQRVRYGNSREAEEQWPHRIMPYRLVTDVQDSPVITDGIRLRVRDSSPLYLPDGPNAQDREELLDVDAVFVATGYQRDLHEMLLQDARHLMPSGNQEGAKWQVGRDYRVRFADQQVGDDAGVWLQGCCESTHGLSDTLLSILATRGGEMVQSIFGSKRALANGEWKGGLGFGDVQQGVGNY